jgi:hypothetical protein
LAVGAALNVSADGGLHVRTTQLQRRLGDLEAREDAKYAKGALQQARRALDSASGPIEDPLAVARAQGIADAAMVLAGRQLARRRSQAALFETQRRLSSVRDRANAQRRVLEALMRERAELARSTELP